MNISEILSAPIFGNAMNDADLMEAIHEFVVDDSNTMEDRCMALQKLDQVMGEDEGLPSPEEVQEYVNLI